MQKHLMRDALIRRDRLNTRIRRGRGHTGICRGRVNGRVLDKWAGRGKYLLLAKGCTAGKCDGHQSGNE